MRAIAFVVLAGLTACAWGQREGDSKKPGGGAAEKPTGPAAAEAKGPLDFKMKDIDGREVDLGRYRGKVVMLVNVASQCGMTPQYEQLQELHEQYTARGLAILGVPANNFGGQEPGSDAEIKEFCTGRYSVKFDMFSKVSVAGDDACPLYRWLTDKKSNPQFGGDIKWNFTKFVVGRDGKVIGRFEPRTKPNDPAVIKLIEEALGAKAP